MVILLTKWRLGDENKCNFFGVLVISSNLLTSWLTLGVLGRGFWGGSVFGLGVLRLFIVGSVTVVVVFVVQGLD